MFFFCFFLFFCNSSKCFFYEIVRVFQALFSILGGFSCTLDFKASVPVYIHPAEAKELVGDRIHGVVEPGADEMPLAANYMNDRVAVKAGVLRCWRSRSVNPEDDDENQKELWVLKFATNNEGEELQRAAEFLESLSVFAELDTELRADRAAKGALQKAIEKGLDVLNGNKKKPKKEGSGGDDA